MRNSKKIVAAAVAGLALSGVANAAQVITSLSLFEMDGTTPIQQTAGVYQLGEGQTFKVQLEISVPDPNFTRADRGTTAALNATENKPLGVQTMSAQILTSANNVVVPMGDGSGPPQKWVNDPNGTLVDVTPDSFGVEVNLNPLGDPDLDVDGAGMLNTSFALANATGNNLSGKQYGAEGGAHGQNMPIAMGDYVASGAGLTSLSAVLNSIKVYQDGTTGTNLSAVDPSNVNVMPAQINVTAVPEPASLGLLGLSGLALFRRRRA